MGGGGGRVGGGCRGTGVGGGRHVGDDNTKDESKITRTMQGGLKKIHRSLCQ